MKRQTAKLNYLRIAPRKVRLVAGALKGLAVDEAEARLLTIPQKSSEPLLKLLRSAIADAKNNQQFDATRLFVKEMKIDQGPASKRWLPRAHGRATPMRKKTSHITLVLAESEKPRETQFKIIKPQRLKKRDFDRMRKEKAERVQQQEKQKAAAKYEKSEEKKQAKGTGFIKKMFRRKVV